MKLSQIGEFALIEHFKNILKIRKKNKDIIVGIGDDTAVLSFTKDKYLLFTEDVIVENIHFKLGQLPLEKIGWKAIACNISDVAAMGGIPKFVLISIGLPAYLKVEDCAKIYKGIKKIAQRYKTAVVGGDTVFSPKNLFISVSLLGEVEKENLVVRSKARLGDRILVTGTLGGSIIKKHFSFLPRLEVSRYLVSNFRLSAMIDISDGLVADLLKIAKMSKRGVSLWGDRIPVSAAAKLLAKQTKKTALFHALGDGEDYELLFTTARNNVPAVISKVKTDLNIKLSEIGEITKRGCLWYSKDNYTELSVQGFDHFK